MNIIRNEYIEELKVAPTIDKIKSGRISWYRQVIEEKIILLPRRPSV